MKTILVPIDYSNTARNAIDYALGLAKQLHADKIILYNAFQPPVPVDNLNIATDTNFNTLGLYDIESLTDSNKMHLERLTAAIKEASGGNMTIESISEFNTLRDGVEELCRIQNISLIVMGISEADGLTENLIGSNSLDIARHTSTPVMLVPHDTPYKPVQQIVFTCDYKNISTTVPTAWIKNLLTLTGAHLHVLHVDADKEIDTHLQQAAILKNLLCDVDADYHTIQHADFRATVNTFTSQHNIDLIIAVPKKHSFFQGLFHHSHTKTLAFHSHIPLLLVHE